MCPLVLSLGTTEKSGSVFFDPHHHIVTHTEKICLSHLFPQLNDPSSLSHSLYVTVRNEI